MVAKCSSPACSASFRYFKEGRLFRLESDPAFSSARVAATEYFWLCHDCSSSMTLHLSEDGSVIPVALAELVHRRASSIPANLQRGLLLSDLSFSIEKRHGNAGFID